MVPAAFVDDTLERFAPLLEPGDVLIDGGNSRYHDDLVRARALRERGLHYVDVGTSGGVWGLERGYCLMIGGETEIVRRLEPIFEALAPGVDAAPRTSGKRGRAARRRARIPPLRTARRRTLREDGAQRDRVRADGSLRRGHQPPAPRRRGLGAQRHDAETTPLDHPEHFQYDLDLPEIAELWRRGSVIGSWLLDLTASALRKDPDLAGFEGRVADSGEGRWTIQAAVEAGRPRARAHGGALRALQLARRRPVREPPAVRAALRVRRPPREGEGRLSPRRKRGTRAVRRAGDLRSDRRPRLQEDLPGAPRDGEARAPRRAGGGRGPRSERCRAHPRPRAGEHRDPRRRRRRRRRSRSSRSGSPTWAETTRRIPPSRRSAPRSARRSIPPSISRFPRARSRS